jgi:predicted enzyme related to lactoylglutathione lyase
MTMSEPAVGRFHWIVIDSVDPAAIAPFWCALLGVEERWWFTEDYLLLSDGGGAVPKIAFQRVPEAKAGKNRLHVDLGVDDLALAAARVLELGGSIVSDERELNGGRWRVMADPEGNEFCLALDD